MKLSNVLLLIVFLIGILFVSVVGDILADVDHDGPYKAEATGFRRNNDNHVFLFASAYSSPFGKNGFYTLRLRIAFTVYETKNQFDKYGPLNRINEHGAVDGHFYDSISDHLKYETSVCSADASVLGESSSGLGHAAFAYEEADAHPLPPPDINPEPQLVGIFPIDPTDIPSPGETHGYKLITAEPYYWVDWYVKAPWHTSERGEFIEGDSGWCYVN